MNCTTSSVRSFLLRLLVLCCSAAQVYAGGGNTRILADDATHSTNVGNVRLTVSNFGTIGTGFANWPKQSSCEYPRNSGIEHLFVGGLWIGGVKNINGNRVFAVSTGAVDVSGVSNLSEGFEFTNAPEAGITERSSLPSSPFYTPSAISHQDFLADFTDTNLIDPTLQQRIPNHDYPLGIAVHMETYAWNFSFADFFVILNYTIKNVSSTPIDSVYTGLWTDMVVRNTKITRPSGSAFYSAGGNGVVDSLHLMYEWDVAGDNGLADSYGATALLGTTPVLDTAFYNNWQFRNSAGDQWLQSPQNDEEKYRRLASSYLNQLTVQQALEKVRAPSNRSHLLSTGPFQRLAPGDSVNVVFAVVCAKKTGTPQTDNSETRSTLVANTGWARRAYNGTDVNGNNKLDTNEIDLRGNGSIVRYVLPTPPPSPFYKLVADNGTATLYWSDNAENSIDIISNKKNFEGYNIYRSNAGDDFDGKRELHLAASFDKPDNGIAADNGFASVRITDEQGAPTRLYFDGDTVGYTYKYEFANLLNGWLYSVAITAFSDGDKFSGLPSLESSILATEINAIPGVRPAQLDTVADVGIYPNPYYVSAHWDTRVGLDGNKPERGRKIYFYHLPERATIRIYSMSGDLIRTLEHDAATNNGEDIGWYQQMGTTGDTHPIFSGGEHSWDLLTDNDQAIASGMYIVHVQDKQTGTQKTGHLLVVK